MFSVAFYNIVLYLSTFLDRVHACYFCLVLHLIFHFNLLQAVRESVKNVEITEREMLAVLQRVHQHNPSEDPNRVVSPLTDPSRTLIYF